MISKLLSAVLLAFFLCVGTLSFEAETRPSVSDLVGQVQATYDKMQSYSSVGDIKSDFSMPSGGRQESHYSFSIKLARPNLYRIEWEMHSPYMTVKGAAWSAGDGNFITVPGQTSPLQPKDLSTALSMATGISGGAAATIPAIFFGMSNDSLKQLERRSVRTGRGYRRRPLLRHNENRSANGDDSLDLEEIKVDP